MRPLFCNHTNQYWYGADGCRKCDEINARARAAKKQAEEIKRLRKEIEKVEKKVDVK